MNITDKQMMIMNAVMECNPDGSKLDLDQLIEKVPYNVTKEAIQFSIRYLIKKGLMIKLGREKRRGRSRIVYGATQEANHLLRRGGPYMSLEDV